LHNWRTRDESGEDTIITPTAGNTQPYLSACCIVTLLVARTVAATANATRLVHAYAPAAALNGQHGVVRTTVIVSSSIGLQTLVYIPEAQDEVAMLDMRPPNDQNSVAHGHV
jgi:hypothetical protein